MATSENMQTISSVASADLTARQFCAVSVSGSRTVATCTAAAKALGLLQNAPASGAAATIAINGVSKAKVGTGGVAAGAELEVGANGTVVTLASGKPIGQALEAGSANDVIAVRLY